MNLKRTWDITKKIAKAMAEGIREGIEKVIDIREEARKVSRGPVLGTDETVTLDAAMMQQIKWMNPAQLKAIFHGKKVKVSGEAEVWRQMKWLNSEQLEAIFGKERS